MPDKNPKKEFWAKYKSLPKDLQDAIFSEKTAYIIFEACAENNIEALRISKIAGYVGSILTGKLPPEQLQPSLELDLEIDSKTAEKICHKIYDTILEPVRDHLEKLYLEKNNSLIKEEKKDDSSPKTQVKSSSDSYREEVK